MNWENVRLITLQEVRDQLRDRRTLFMILVLPLVLYPLLGMTVFQLAQFMREKPSRVIVLGGRQLQEDVTLPALIDPANPRRFDKLLFADQRDWSLLVIEEVGSRPIQIADKNTVAEWAEKAIGAGQCDIVVWFPPDFVNRLHEWQEKIETSPESAGEVPDPEVFYSTAQERSQAAAIRLNGVLQKWQEQIAHHNLEKQGVPVDVIQPFRIQQADLARQRGTAGIAIWAKILPVILVIWAMTGAFYPAIDLCAGEKERGTLETLLTSPASRTEIVLAKLAATTCFSIVTAVVNLISMGITGWWFLSKLPQFGLPPLSAILWLGLALVPTAALFSALSLSLAAFARSTREAQYYLMPLMLVTMPLALLPMTPTSQLTVGSSLIPVSGMVLLLRRLIEGRFETCWPFLFPVGLTTLVCCWLAVRWAVQQFNSEAVLFREGERIGLRTLWRHLLRDREELPAVSTAVLCGVLVLVLRFFLSLSAKEPASFKEFAATQLYTQLGMFVLPAILLAWVTTTNWRVTLGLMPAGAKQLGLAALAAVFFHPLVRHVQLWLTQLFPPPPVLAEFLERLQQLIDGAPIWQVILVIAIVPAFCEELIFRGFILAGFRRLSGWWRPALYSALFFALAHPVFQQQVLAFTVGIILGMLTVSTGSIMPAVVFHAVHNALATIIARASSANFASSVLMKQLLGHGEQLGLLYHPIIVVISTVVAIALVLRIAAVAKWSRGN